MRIHTAYLDVGFYKAVLHRGSRGRRTKSNGKGEGATMIGRLIGPTFALVAAVAGLTLIAGSALAQKPVDEPAFQKVIADMCKTRGAIECFADSAGMTYTLCGLVTELAISRGGNADFDRSRQYVADAKANVAPQFERARRSAAANKEVDAMLKDAYAFWLTAIDGLTPKYQEPGLVYRGRVGQQKETLEHKLNRLKLEK